MGKFSIIFFIVSIALAVFVSKCAIGIFGNVELPENILEPDLQWGPKGSEKEDPSIQPFKIAVSEAAIRELKQKLNQEIKSANRLSPPLEGIGFQYGFNSKYLQTVINYWLEKYDWKSRENNLNRYEQFKTKIAGLNIHFQHVKSKSNSNYKKTLPLLLMHGWPGSFVEFQPIIPLLTEPKDSDFNFELIIPSLPGYGFSDGPVRPGLGAAATSQILLKLMKRLGHEKFYVEGGDWGALIAVDMATMYPNNVIGLHSSMCASQHPLTTIRMLLAANFPSFFLTAEEADRFVPYSKFIPFLIRETGYFHIQATKPDTIGVSLSNSPSGLAAYILEKFAIWTNANGHEKEDGGLTESFTMDQLLDNIMIYWVSNSITTSMRFYAENTSKQQTGLGLDRIQVKAPTGCVVGGNDPFLMHTKEMVQYKFPNILSYNYFKDGGHFFAYEQPALLAKDIFSFIQKVDKLKKN